MNIYASPLAVGALANIVRGKPAFTDIVAQKGLERLALLYVLTLYRGLDGYRTFRMPDVGQAKSFGGRRLQFDTKRGDINTFGTVQTLASALGNVSRQKFRGAN